MLQCCARKIEVSGGICRVLGDIFGILHKNVEVVLAVDCSM
jgi:hypothetical protein